MSESFLAEITAFGGNFAPRGWALCDGQILPIAQNQALYSLLGTTYGGDGRTSFALPDLRGRAIRHAGQGAGLSPIALGQKGGAATMQLTQANLPAHDHGVTLHAENDNADISLPAGNMLGRAGEDTIYTAPTDDRDNVAMAPQAIVEQSVGGSLGYESRSPYQGVNMIICIQGLFPSRN